MNQEQSSFRYLKGHHEIRVTGIPLGEKKKMEVRLDKWLWAARFFRTRQKAIEAIKGGKVHVNGQRSKPSKTVFIQDLIELSFGSSQKIVVIKAISNERKGAKVACELFEETQESIEAREKGRKLGAFNRLSKAVVRPSKKQRRQITRFKRAQSD